MVKCITCGGSFEPTNRKNCRPYKNCPDCRKSLMKSGTMGGSATKEKLGHEHYVNIGRKGGSVIKKMAEEYQKNHAQA